MFFVLLGRDSRNRTGVALEFHSHVGRWLCGFGDCRPHTRQHTVTERKGTLSQGQITGT